MNSFEASIYMADFGLRAGVLPTRDAMRLSRLAVRSAQPHRFIIDHSYDIESLQMMAHRYMFYHQASKSSWIKNQVDEIEDLVMLNVDFNQVRGRQIARFKQTFGEISYMQGFDRWKSRLNICPSAKIIQLDCG